MARERIQTALIMEDDVDWDVMLKAQMVEIARGTRYLQNITSKDKPHSPYGDNWWLLSTGNCGVSIKTEYDQKHWVIDNDPTVIPWKHRKLFRHPNAKPKELSGMNTRLIFGLKGFICTASYAISLTGATNTMYDQGVLPHAKPVCPLPFPH